MDLTHANLITSSAGANDDQFLKTAEIEDAVRDLRFGLVMIAINPVLVCSALQLSYMSEFIGKPEGRFPANTRTGLENHSRLPGGKEISHG